MSLRYKLLGVPKTLDEFLDSTKRKDYRQMDISVNTVVFDGLDPTRVHCSVLLKAYNEQCNGEHEEYRLKSWEENGKGYAKAGVKIENIAPYQTPYYIEDVVKLKVELMGLGYGIAIAEKLKKRRFRVTVNGNNTKVVKKRLESIVKNIQHLNKRVQKIKRPVDALVFHGWDYIGRGHGTSG